MFGSPQRYIIAEVHISYAEYRIFINMYNAHRLTI
jgi:hypothetical protein